MANDTTAEETKVLVGRIRSADPAAVTMLDSLFREPLLRFCWGYLGNADESEDAVHEVWCRVLGGGEIPEHFRPWLYRIARNYCLNALRHRKVRGCEGALPDASQIHESLTGHLTRMVADERDRKLLEAVEELPPVQRELLRLRYVEELSRSEIAEVMGMPVSKVKTQLFEGLKKLRSHTSLFDDQ